MLCIRPVAFSNHVLFQSLDRVTQRERLPIRPWVDTSMGRHSSSARRLDMSPVR